MMKIDYNRKIVRIVTVVGLLSLGGLLSAASAAVEAEARLKPGAKGELCLSCHEKFKAELSAATVHPLLKKRECTGCHAPHTSDHDNLLAVKATRLCADCHQAVLPPEPRSAHAMAYAGDCGQCHDSHGSDNAFMLKASGNDLCVGCHADVGEVARKAAFKHDPLRSAKGGCLSCHRPHASGDQPYLLKASAPGLCRSCHDVEKADFVRKHQGYAVAGSNCITCHNPHGSDKPGLILADAHAPVAANKCTDCHPEPGTPGALAPKKTGNDLCRGCHQEMVDKTLAEKRLHWPVVDRKGCLNCHAPHAGKQQKLLKAPVGKLCGTCHADTIERQQVSIDNPENKKLCEPVKTGNCIACHAPHASENVLLFAAADINAGLCGKCHEWQSHSTHPIGAQVVDQRNRNLTMDCLSCHRGCGTENNRVMLIYPTTSEVCVQCHVDRKR